MTALAFPKPQKLDKEQRRLASRVCRNFLCRQSFIPSPRFPNSKYCVSCTIDRLNAKQKKKAEKSKRCKGCKDKFVGKGQFCKPECFKAFRDRARLRAMDRKKLRRASKKKKKAQTTAYPHAGFAAKRRQMGLFETACEITGMSNAEHLKKFNCGLHLDHIVPARVAEEAGADPHVEVNLMWLSNIKHGEKKKAEEHLRKKNFYSFILELQKLNWPMHRVKAAMKHCGLYSDNLPWGFPNLMVVK